MTRIQTKAIRTNASKENQHFAFLRYDDQVLINAKITFPSLLEAKSRDCYLAILNLCH